jgi:cytochrome P450
MNIMPPLEKKLNPFPFYAEMRHNYPVTYDDKNRVWGIFRYKDVQHVLTNHADFSSDFSNWSEQRHTNQHQSSSRQTMMTTDPPHHKRLRGAVSSAFSPTRISKLESRIEGIANELLNKVIEEGEMDLIKDFAYPLPATVIAELLGISPQDRDLFKGWADQLLRIIGSIFTKDVSPSEIIHYHNEMDAYFAAIIEDKKKKPGDDLLSYLVTKMMTDIPPTAQSNDGDDTRLTVQEVIGFGFFLLQTGHITTVNLIGNTVLSLLENPQELKKLQMDRSLIPKATEESLRYRSPVQVPGSRFAIKDAEIGGQKIRKGDMIMTFIGSANRDEAIFRDPDRFDITRQNSAEHIAFGAGVHFCLGANLAVLEGKVALKVILERLDNLEFALEDDKNQIKPLPIPFFYGVANLPLRFSPSITT